MKISFIGTHGTGKTTLACELSAELKKRNRNALPLLEVARDCPLPISEQTSIKAQVWIMTAQIAREIELSKQFQDIVCDRSVLDNYIYLFYKFGHQQPYFNLMKEWLKTYDFLFKVNIREGYLKDDGFRSTDQQFQKDIDECFNKILFELNQKHFIFTSVQDALKIILATRNL